MQIAKKKKKALRKKRKNLSKVKNNKKLPIKKFIKKSENLLKISK